MRGVRKIALILLSFIALHMLAMVVFEGLSAWQAFWLTLTTLTTVGYGETLPIRDDPMAQMLAMGLMVGGMGVVIYFASTLTAFIVEGDLLDLLRRRRMERTIRGLSDHIVLCGAGRMGRAAADELLAAERSFVVLDRDAQALERMEHDHPGRINYLQLDAVEDESLEAAGVRRANGLIAALSTDQDNVYVAIAAKSLNPDIQVVSKAIDANAEKKLSLAGADRVVPVNTLGGRRLASEMIRPEVTSFLDHMLSDHERTLRIEEIPVPEGSPFVGKRLADSEIRQAAEVLVIAVRDAGGRYHYNPGADYPICADETLIVIGNPRQVRSLQTL